jgi:hypothetical protein
MARDLYVSVRRGLIQTTGPSPKRKEEEEDIDFTVYDKRMRKVCIDLLFCNERTHALMYRVGVSLQAGSGSSHLFTSVI